MTDDHAAADADADSGGDEAAIDGRRPAAGDEGQTERTALGTDTADTVLALASAVFTVCLLAYVGWHVATGTAATQEPTAHVVGVTDLPGGGVAVTVGVANPYDGGLTEATVESQCTDPPARVTLAMVPADATARGTIRCPTGTTDPSVTLTSWRVA